MLTFRGAQGGGGLRHVELSSFVEDILSAGPHSGKQGRLSLAAGRPRHIRTEPGISGATSSVLLGNFIRPHASSWVPPAPAPVPPWRSTMCADSPAAPALRAPACKPLAAGAHCCCRSSKWTTRRHMHVQQCGQEGQRL